MTVECTSEFTLAKLVLIFSVFKQLCRSKHDQNSKIKSTKNSFKGLACSLQDSQKSRLNHTAQSDKLASAKYSNCLLAITNIWFIRVLFKPPSSHPSEILASRKIKQPCRVWWGGILQYHLTNEASHCNLAGTADLGEQKYCCKPCACKAIRRASSITSFC